jgi:hypothetical protein
LTTCSLVKEGQAIRLEFLNGEGQRAIGWALGHELQSTTEGEGIGEPIDDRRLLN